jgi:hypothetical protein
MDDEDYVLLCKAILFGVACMLLGMVLAHWMIWG